MTQKTSISPETAFAAYLGLGPSRNLRALHGQLLEEEVRLSWRTLSSWSKRGQWVARAAAHDAAVGRVAQRTVAEHQAKELGEVLITAHDFGARIIHDLAQLWADGEISVTTPSAVATMADAAISLQRHGVAERGGASDRARASIVDDTRERMKDLADRFSDAALEAGSNARHTTGTGSVN